MALSVVWEFYTMDMWCECLWPTEQTHTHTAHTTSSKWWINGERDRRNGADDVEQCHAKQTAYDGTISLFPRRIYIRWRIHLSLRRAMLSHSSGFQQMPTVAVPCDMPTTNNYDTHSLLLLNFRFVRYSFVLSPLQCCCARRALQETKANFRIWLKMYRMHSIHT